MKTTLDTIYRTKAKFYLCCRASAYDEGTIRGISGRPNTLTEAINIVKTMRFPGCTSVVVHTNTQATGQLDTDAPMIATFLVIDGTPIE